MTKLDFVVPGFSKCGTTTLCALLAEHPGITISTTKEPNFFATEYERGWDWYESLFSGSGNSIRGEGSTFYTVAEFEEAASSRIAKHFPDVKLIFIARDPIRRIESSYREHHHSGHRYGVDIPYDMGDALVAFPNIIEDTMYWQRLNAYRRRFSDEQIHILLFEDFVRAPQDELKKCFRFLGVDPNASIDDSHRQLNPAESKLRDSAFMRWIRSHKLTNVLWNGLAATRDERLEQLLGLRKTAPKSVYWTPAARNLLRWRLEDDMAQFLSHCGKPSDCWRLEWRERGLLI